MDCFIDRTNNNRQISSVYYGDYARTLTGGTNFGDIADPAGQGEWVSPIHQDPVDANIAYTAGRSALYKTSNIWATTVTWQTMGTPPGNTSITELAIAPSNNQVIYALKDGSGGVSKSTNGGTSFTSCANPTTAASPSSPTAALLHSAGQAPPALRKTQTSGRSRAGTSPWQASLHSGHFPVVC